MKQIKTTSGKKTALKFGSTVISRIMKDLFKTECKNAGTTKETEAEAVRKFIINNYQTHERRINNHVNIVDMKPTTERLIKHKISIIKKLYVNPTTTSGMYIYQADNFQSYKNKDYDWNYYAKSYNHPKVSTYLTININTKEMKLNNVKYWVIDGMLNIKIKSIKKLGDVTIIHAETIYNKKSGLIAVDNYIAVNAEYNYHAETIKKAIKGLTNKMQIKIKKEITLDTIITPKIYHETTGACYAGINSFCEKIGARKMKCSELLELIKNQYGYDKFVKNIVNV